MTKEQQGVVLFLGLIMLSYFIWDYSLLFPPASLEKMKGHKLTQISPAEIYKYPGSSELIDVWGKNALVKQSQSFDLKRQSQEGEARNVLVISSGENNRGAVFGENISPSAFPGLFRPIDINKASLEELRTIPGIGPLTAQAILAFRNENGPFKSVEDLLQVRGVGPKKLAAIRGRITVQ